MQTLSNADDMAQSVLSFVAANDAEMTDIGLRVKPRTSAWDPYDVWRTRVLPYQNRLREAAEQANKSF